MGSSKRHVKLFLACTAIATVCAVQAADAAAELTPGQAKRVALTTVTQSASNQQISSPFAPKLKSCKVNGNRANCKVYRSVSQACRLHGAPSPGTICADVVAHRLWTVKVNGNTGSITGFVDVIGQFEPTAAASARR